MKITTSRIEPIADSSLWVMVIYNVCRVWRGIHFGILTTHSFMSKLLYFSSYIHFYLYES